MHILTIKIVKELQESNKDESIKDLYFSDRWLKSNNDEDLMYNITEYL